MKQKTIFKWCGPRLTVSGPANNLTIHGIDYLEECLNWVCHCKHTRDEHHWLSDRCWCGCETFKYLNNDRCSIECQFLRKLYEQENGI